MRNNKTYNINLLIIEDEAFDVERIQNTIKLAKNNIQIKNVVSNGKQALEDIKSKQGAYDVIIMDFKIAGGIMGERLIRKIKDIEPAVQILVVTKMTIQQTDFDFANELIKAGAFWYCTKYPGDIQDYIYQPTDFVLAIVNAYKKKKLELEKLRSEDKLENNIKNILDENTIVGKTDSVEKLKNKIHKYAEANANVIIYGESGTGKELIATNIHYLSKRRYESFICVNCASIPKDLIESELFGHKKGSFTGASENREGYFEQADKGTIFLDEISEFPLSAQAKLLRVLQEGEIDKIGRKSRKKVDVRIIAASNKDLKKMVADGKFREDLYYRLNVLSIEAPALTERKEDIPRLVDYFVKQFAYDMGLMDIEVTDEAISILKKYDWPGNIRQLQNVIQRLLILNDSLIDAKEVKEALNIDDVNQYEDSFLSDSKNVKIEPLRRIEKRFRKKYIHYVRENSKTDAEAAHKLGLAPPNFHRICKSLGLKS
ncbi:MAG: sigma-54 dependent transcriptional regulator [Candidatus Marinimicrobia bacterium]|nr:sigma-54 dependent transcriptional regulator [Candidatus Neomarinimicrobiota bacterium]